MEWKYFCNWSGWNSCHLRKEKACYNSASDPVTNCCFMKIRIHVRNFCLLTWQDLNLKNKNLKVSEILKFIRRYFGGGFYWFTFAVPITIRTFHFSVQIFNFGHHLSILIPSYNEAVMFAVYEVLFYGFISISYHSIAEPWGFPLIQFLSVLFPPF